MELKDYLRILHRRWPIIIAVFMAAAIGFYAATLVKRPSYYSTLDVHFKQTPLELGFFQPEDYAYPYTSMPARIYLFSNPKVLEDAAALLREREKTAVDASDIERWIKVAEAGIEKTATLTATHAEKSMPPKIARALFDAYLNYMVAENRKAFLRAQERIDRLLTEAATNLKRSEEDRDNTINDLYARQHIADPENQAQIMSSIIIDMERTRQLNLIEIRRIEDRLARLPEAERRLAEEDLIRHHGAPYVIASVAPGTDLGARLKELNLKLARLRKKYLEAHPTIVSIKEEILELQNELSAEIQRPTAEKAAALLEQKELLSSSVGLIEDILSSEYGKLKDIQSGRFKVAAASKMIDEETAAMAKLHDRKRTVDEAKGRNEQMTEQSIVAVREMAEAREQVIQARGASWPVMIAVSLIVAIMSAFLVDYLSDTIRTSNDIKIHLNLPTIASLPDLKGQPHNLLDIALKSPVYEVYNKLATFVEAQARDQKARTLLITSTKAEEGKTTISSNLAIALAQGGMRVVLIDADLRKPSVHSLFGLDNSRGLSTALGAGTETEPASSQPEDAEIESYLQTTRIPTLRVMTSGPVPLNPVGLLKSERAKWLIDQLSSRCDLIIFDSPPNLGVIDSVVLAAMTDMTIVVIAEGAVRRTEVAQLKHAMGQVDANVIGAVINKAGATSEAYYYYYYYRYRGYTA